MFDTSTKKPCSVSKSSPGVRHRVRDRAHSQGSAWDNWPIPNGLGEVDGRANCRDPNGLPNSWGWGWRLVGLGATGLARNWAPLAHRHLTTAHIGDVMDARPPAILVHRVETNEVFLGMTRHLGWGSCHHKVARNAPPIAFPSVPRTRDDARNPHTRHLRTFHQRHHYLRPQISAPHHHHQRTSIGESASPFTLTDELLYALNMATDTNVYVSTLKYHVIPNRRHTFFYLQNLTSSFLETLQPNYSALMQKTLDPRRSRWTTPQLSTS
ncbi:vacuolar fusion protein mon1, partial [Striga asiatica]